MGNGGAIELYTRCNLITTDVDKCGDLMGKFLAQEILSGRKCFFYTEKFLIDEIKEELGKNNLKLSQILKEEKLIIKPIKFLFKALNSGSDELKEASLIIDLNSLYLEGMKLEEFLKCSKLVNGFLKKYSVRSLLAINVDRVGIETLLSCMEKNGGKYLYKVDNKIQVYDSDQSNDIKKDSGFIYSFMKEFERVRRKSNEELYLSSLIMELSYKRDEVTIATLALESLCNNLYANSGIILLTGDGRNEWVNYNFSQELMEIFGERNLINYEKIFTDVTSDRGYCILNTVYMPKRMKELFTESDLTSSILLRLNYENQTYGFMWLAFRNQYNILNSNIDFLTRVAEIIGKLIHNYRDYKNMCDIMENHKKMQALGELSGGIVHEFNNILTPILGYTQILKNKLDHVDINNYINMIEKSALDGAKIVRRIQDFARKDRKISECIDIDKVIFQSVEMMKPRWTYESQVKGRHINVKTNLESGAFVEGVETELREVFINLISNSIDAMSEDGDITIITKNCDGMIKVVFEDTGDGIPDAILYKVFEPFFTTKGEQGNGFGLSIVYNIIKSMGGTIEVDSTIGCGTKFLICLPESKEFAKEELIEVCVDINERFNVLIIDDQVEVAETVCEMFNMIGHRAVYETDYYRALKKFESEKFDYVVCDLAMPHITGIDLCEKLKEINDGFIFILMTGWPGKLKDEELSLIDGILQKPFSFEDIRNIIKSTIKC